MWQAHFQNESEKCCVRRTRFPFLIFLRWCKSLKWNLWCQTSCLNGDRSPQHLRPPSPTHIFYDILCDRGVASVTQPVSHWLWFLAENQSAHSASSHIIIKTKTEDWTCTDSRLLCSSVAALLFICCCCFFFMKDGEWNIFFTPPILPPELLTRSVKLWQNLPSYQQTGCLFFKVPQRREFRGSLISYGSFCLCVSQSAEAVWASKNSRGWLRSFVLFYFFFTHGKLYVHSTFK